MSNVGSALKKMKTTRRRFDKRVIIGRCQRGVPNGAPRQLVWAASDSKASGEAWRGAAGRAKKFTGAKGKQNRTRQPVD